MEPKEHGGTRELPETIWVLSQTEFSKPVCLLETLDGEKPLGSFFIAAWSPALDAAIGPLFPHSSSQRWPLPTGTLNSSKDSSGHHHQVRTYPASALALTVVALFHVGSPLSW